MVTTRTALAGACLTLTMLTAAACQQINDAISSRDLECEKVPDGLCTRLADDIVGTWDSDSVAEYGPILSVVVKRVGCGDLFTGFERKDPAAVRCFQAQATVARPPDAPDGMSFGEPYYQHADGGIFDGHQRVIGTFPVE